MAGWSSGADPRNTGNARRGLTHSAYTGSERPAGDDPRDGRGEQPGGATHGYGQSEPHPTTYPQSYSSGTHVLTGARADGTVNTMDTSWASKGGRSSAERARAFGPREVTDPTVFRYLWLMLVATMAAALAIALHRDPAEPTQRLVMVLAGLAVVGIYIRASGGRVAVIIATVVGYGLAFYIAHHSAGGDILIPQDPISTPFMKWFIPAMALPALLIPRALLTGIRD